MHIDRIISFIIDKEKGKPDGRLRMRVKWNNSRSIVAFGIGFRVEHEKWSTATQRCVANTIHGKRKVSASFINREIQRHEEAANEVFARFERDNVTPTPDEYRATLRQMLDRPAGHPSGMAIDTYIDRFIEEGKRVNGWQESTVKKFRTLSRILSEYNPRLTFRDLDEDGMAGFLDHLRDRRGFRNTTADKTINLLKWFLRWAVRRGYMHDQSFAGFRPHLKSAKRTVVYLTWDELMRVYNMPIPPQKRYLERVRDVFCLCCFTSLRYSDVARLRPEDIYGGCIHMVSHKTADSLSIELNRYSKTIIDRYRGGDYGGLAMPVISNQRMNEYLKELGAHCGLDTPVTTTYYRGGERIDETRPKWALIGTHTARRTFICNALALGISPLVVMKWTGHESYETMRPYIEVADRTKAEAMRLFDAAGKEEARHNQSQDSWEADNIRSLT